MNRLGASGRPFLFVVDYRQERVWIEEAGKVNPDEILYAVKGFTNGEIVPESPERVPVEWKSYPVPEEEYARAFAKVQDHIRAGNSYLVNLTFATPVETNLSLKDIFYRSAAPYKLWMKDCFVVFSPETFVRIDGKFIYSYPMKGTVDAALPDARRYILENEKEAAEHATIVDLIRNDLSRVASEVQVTRYRFIDEIHTHKGALLQVSSEIRGRLPADWPASLGTILFRLLPAGSVTGAPKKKTLEIIATAETYKRGFYTGIMGYFDGYTLDSAVMIRFLEQRDGQFLFKSGGGITSRSEWQAEYEEMKQKVYVPIY